MKKERTSKNKKKNCRIQTGMNRYAFYSLFRFDPATNLLYTLYNTSINGLYYPAGTAIARGLTFGGLDLYSFMGRDVAGNFGLPPTPPTVIGQQLLTIVGFY